jgi:coenzyme F420-dependent glucose-6-phosphate dehydrogenase
MVQFGYALSSEEHTPSALVANAVRAEEAGFEFVSISDHFHPWIDAQGQSSFVWSVIGAIASSTDRIKVGTGVTCPIIRIHPVILAQAAATVTSMMPGRFLYGVGTGENLNEHVLGAKWPIVSVRQDMLAEAIEITRMLWDGRLHTFQGRFFSVENARIYTLPDEPPPIIVAASGPESAELAGRIGDGLWSTSTDPDISGSFEKAGGHGPRFAQITLCFAKTEDEALATARGVWPTSALTGQLNQELPLPEHFAHAVEMVKDDDLRESMSLGPDPAPVLDKVREAIDAGFDWVYFHQVGRDQEAFFEFWERELRPQLGE